MARFLALTALFLACEFAAASAPKSCGEFDLRSQFGAVRDQGHIGWCYAFAYADLLGQTLKMKVPDKVSAMDVATTYASNDASFYGKSLEQRNAVLDLKIASDSYLERGRLCTESQIPSETMKKAVSDPFAALSGEEDESAYFVRQKVKNTWAELSLNPPPDALDLNAKKSPYDVPCNVGAFDIYSQRRTRDISALSNRLNDWVTQYIQSKHDRICAKDPRLEKIQARQIDINSDGPEKIKREARSLLSAKKPFIIGFDSNPFRKNKQEGGGHAAVVVGRRWNETSKNCELLVRNSWGGGCDYYRSDIKCEHGNFWASEKELLSKTSQILSLNQ